MGYRTGYSLNVTDFNIAYYVNNMYTKYLLNLHFNEVYKATSKLSNTD